MLLGDSKIEIARIGKDVDNIKSDIEKIQPDLQDVREKVSGLSSVVELLRGQKYSESHSPVSLNQKGRELFDESGIKSMIDREKVLLCDNIKKKNPQTAYDVQEYSRIAMLRLIDDPNTSKQLKEKAYQLGVDVVDILFVGSFYLRDLALKECGFKFEDLDKK